MADKILIDSIHYLVKRDGFVIVPEWGAFFLQPVSARWDSTQQIFFSPCYQLLFNPRINNNDGVLAIYISKEEKCSYFDALQVISLLVVKWHTQLIQFENLRIENLGLFVLQKGVINFQSNIQNQVFPEFFGLQNIYVHQNNDDRSVIFSYPALKESKYYNTIVKTLVLVPMALTLALLPSKINNYRLSKNHSASFSQKIKIHQLINNPQDISNSIDTMTNLKVSLQMDSKEEVKIEKPTKREEKIAVLTEENKNTRPIKIISLPQHKYFVIIGSFTNNKQVNDFLFSLKAININGIVLNCNGKLRIALNSFDSQTKAQKALNEFKTMNPSYSGWVLYW